MPVDSPSQVESSWLGQKWGRLGIAVKAASELGLSQVWLYARYWLGLRSGIYRRMRPPDVSDWAAPADWCCSPSWPDLPNREQLRRLLGEQAILQALAEADQVVAGQVRLFGGPPVPVDLCPPAPLRHWVDAGHASSSKDVKMIWEPARFGWAVQLARAYHLSLSEVYAQAFWGYVETFLDANPAYMGPNWASAQEVSLRLMALIFAARVFAASPHSTSSRMARLGQALVEHAARIPLTLVYARAQNNNHLLSEAAALYTAGLFLSGHPQAQSWLSLGRKWFASGLQAQIDPHGAYIQHSANYQRLMLQLALWVAALEAGRKTVGESSEALPAEARQALAASTRWLLALVDPHSGQAPNLGPNDGACFLPLSGCDFEDYRPVLQAAARRFLGAVAFAPGPWDELGLWLGDDFASQPQTSLADKFRPGNQIDRGVRLVFDSKGDRPGEPYILDCPASDSWAYLRAAHFRSRPGHADQLHLDLWWRGLNLARDPGTYLYNARPPWDNALTHAAVHNTLLLNGLDQMQRAGRFLYLEWAQARLVEAQTSEDGAYVSVVAEHDGYRRRLGVIHRRSVVACCDGGWLVEDRLLSAGRPPAGMVVRLHWLLPDWPWEVQGSSIRLESPHGAVQLQIRFAPATDIPAGGPAPIQTTLVRAGELLHGSGPAHPTWGWFSPTYALKLPALSFSVDTVTKPGFCFSSQWILG